jgi:hypothetical protein
MRRPSGVSVWAVIAGVADVDDLDADGRELLAEWIRVAMAASADPIAEKIQEMLAEGNGSG